MEVPAATHLDIILYSREQLVKEYAAMPTKAAEGADPEALLPQAPWGIISIKVRASGVGSTGSGAVFNKPCCTQACQAALRCSTECIRECRRGTRASAEGAG